MKVCLPADAPDLDEPVAKRFGRAACLVIADIESGEAEFIDNGRAASMEHGAGKAAAALAASKGIRAVIACRCGPKAFQAFRNAGIGVYFTEPCTLKQGLDAYKKGELTKAKRPNAVAHWS